MASSAEKKRSAGGAFLDLAGEDAGGGEVEADFLAGGFLVVAADLGEAIVEAGGGEDQGRIGGVRGEGGEGGEHEGGCGEDKAERACGAFHGGNGTMGGGGAPEVREGAGADARGGWE